MSSQKYYHMGGLGYEHDAVHVVGRALKRRTRVCMSLVVHERAQHAHAGACELCACTCHPPLHYARARRVRLCLQRQRFTRRAARKIQVNLHRAVRYVRCMMKAGNTGEEDADYECPKPRVVCLPTHTHDIDPIQEGFVGRTRPASMTSSIKQHYGEPTTKQAVSIVHLIASAHAH
jgi:hypothetical protein